MSCLDEDLSSKTVFLPRPGEAVWDVEIQPFPHGGTWAGLLASQSRLL